LVDNYQQFIAAQQDAELVSGALGDAAFIADTQALAPMAQAALERIRLRLQLLGTRADTREIEAAQCL
jgi:hypothetical protein